MARNFRVDIINKNLTGLFIRVMGDFDGSSAYRLIGIINKEGKRLTKITIDTDGLKDVHPFGCNIFSTNMKNRGVSIYFLGRFKNEFDYD